MILAGTPEAKAAHWGITDAEARKPRERTGLDTPVVLAVNTEHSRRGASAFFLLAKALSVPPGEYGRKAETQRN